MERRKIVRSCFRIDEERVELWVSTEGEFCVLFVKKICCIELNHSTVSWKFSNCIATDFADYRKLGVRKPPVKALLAKR